jgi:hypothetical protein
MNICGSNIIDGALKVVKETLTRRSAPARELNLVAVTTRRFLGSTAPTATSGVSTTATNFGGAVRIAARPNRIAKGERPGVPVPQDGLIGVVGVRGPATLNRPLLIELAFEVDLAKESRRCEADAAEVERESAELFRDRRGA